MAETQALHFDHIGLVVASLKEGREHLANTLGITRWTDPFDDPGLGVSVQFGVSPEAPASPAIELIAPLGSNSPIAGALRTGHRILSHLAYLTPDLPAASDNLRTQGCVATGPPHPALAYRGRPVQFFISPLRFMIELIEAPAHQHAYREPLGSAQSPEPSA